MQVQDADARKKTGLFQRIGQFLGNVPFSGWLLAFLVAVILEQLVGLPLAKSLGMRKCPALFGLLLMLKKPNLILSSLAYTTCIYIIPILLVAKLTTPITNALSRWMLKLPIVIPHADPSGAALCGVRLLDGHQRLPADHPQADAHCRTGHAESEPDQRLHG